MIRVEQGNSRIAKGIVIDKTCPSFSGILCGNSEGKVWVDRLDSPTHAIVYSSPVGAFRVLGKAETEEAYEALIDFIQNDLFHQIQAEGESEFEFAADDEELEQKLLASFGAYNIIVDQELSYLQEKKEVLESSPIGSYTIRKVDAEFLGEAFSNKEFVTQRLLESWGTEEQYLAYGAAFVALDEDKIIGVILGSSNYQDILPIDIETLEGYREAGIATELTKCFLNYCTENQKTAYWNCITSNTASQRVAEKAGFDYKGKNNYYYFSFA